MCEKEAEEIKPDEQNDYNDYEQKNDEQKSVTTCGESGCIHSLIIAGQIEGHYSASNQAKSTKYEQIIPTLVAVEESSEIDGLLILLNTIGGDVEAGLAIAEVIAGMRKPTVSLVLGGSHSIGVPLAVAAKRSFIVPSATMTLHPVRINGLVIGVPQSFDYFEKMQMRIIEFITRNSSANGEELKSMIMKTDQMTTDIGTVLGGAEAVEKGLIDRVGSLGDALSCLKRMIGNENP
jgi:ATP-dependent protease ClpP protease subunit